MQVRVAWTRKRDEVGSLAGFFLPFDCLLLLTLNRTPSQGAFFSARSPRGRCAGVAHPPLLPGRPNL